MTEFEIEIDAPAETVWHALRDKDQILQWHGWQFDGLDAEVDVIYRDGSTELEPGRSLLMQSSDTFTVTDLGGRTRLTMTRSPKGQNPDWDDYYEDITEGWTTFMQQLRFMVERHANDERRTVFLDGDPLREKARALSTRLDGPVGASYEILAPNGEQLSGEVWFRSANQVGVTVKGWGDGLLVVGEQAVSPMRPEGGAMLVLSTYGLSDEDFTRLETAWTQWWS